MLKNILLLLLAVLGLSACTADTASLPLAEGKATLLFFYTDS